MNIFALDSDPVTSAMFHCDKHVVKMILEYCQLLSTTHRLLDGNKSTIIVPYTRNSKALTKSKTVWTMSNPTSDFILYQVTHQNHPSAIWTRQSIHHYRWLTQLLSALCDEYTFRYGPVHKCQRIGLVDFLIANPPKNIPDNGFVLPTPAMPDECKVPGDVVQSYRNYYMMHKQRMFAWRKRGMPDFVADAMLKEVA